MSSVTHYTCDGCGTKASDKDAGTWWMPYTPVEGTKHLCAYCTARFIAAIGAKPSDAERRETVALERNAELETLLKDAKKHVYDITCECDHLKRQLPELEAAYQSANKRAAKLEVDLSDARDEAELAESDKRVLVREVIAMLGKKARKRHEQRIAEISRLTFTVCTSPATYDVQGRRL